MRRPSAPLVVSVAALVLAVTGTAFAGGYIITSTKQIKPSVRKALKGNRGPRGFDGADGGAGAPGAPGSPGILALKTVESPPVTIPPGGTSFGADPNSLVAQCPPGFTVVGSGVDTGIGNLDLLKKYGTFVGGFVDNDTSITIQAAVQAICAQLGAGATDTRSAAAKDDRTAFLAEVRALAAR